MNLYLDIQINRPVEKVWQAVSKIEGCADFISGILQLEVLKRPEQGLVGLKWRETRKMFGQEASETMWITEAVENRYYCTRAENHGAIYTTRLQLEPNSSATTRLSMSFEATSESLWVRLISKLMTPLIKGSMIKALKQDLEDIKAFVESR